MFVPTSYCARVIVCIHCFHVQVTVCICSHHLLCKCHCYVCVQYLLYTCIFVSAFCYANVCFVVCIYHLPYQCLCAFVLTPAVQM